MLGIFKTIFHKYEYRKLLKKIKSSITQHGGIIEVAPGTSIGLFEGSTKEDIVLLDNIMLIGCTIISSHKGKVTMGNHTRLGRGTRLYCVDHVTIGDYTTVANYVTITDNNNHPVNPDFRFYMRTSPHGSDARSWIHSDHKPIVIGKNCWVGENSRIQKGVTIGDNSIIAACSVVTKDVPANCIAAGNPAKIVKTDIDQIPAPTSCDEYNKYINHIKSE